ncbi:MAG: anthranilate synthase component I family protein [Candidatus Levyibacteriota bacterium]
MKRIKLSQKPIYIPSKDHEDIYELFLKIEEEFSSCFFYESLGQDQEARYTILGFDPEHIVASDGKNFLFDDKEVPTKNPYHTLQEIMPQDKLSKKYAGGFVGYMGYDAMQFFEPTLAIRKHPLFQTFMFGVYTDGVIYDKVTGELTYFYYDTNRLQKILDVLQKPLRKRKISVFLKPQNITKEEHAKMIASVKEEILAGNTFQAQIGLQQEFTNTGDAAVLYDRLRRVNPSPFMYYLKFGETKIIGASPELLFGMKDKEMQTFPLAGTIQRGSSLRDDKELAHKLLTDRKELAEHSMLVDLHRNDMGKIARFGSVKVRSLMDIKRFSHVQHISSEVVGLLRPGEDMFSGLAANFPAGTVTGAPKIESMKIIEKLEKAPRGPYAGALGHFGFNGDCTFAIPIRTIFMSGNYGFTQASSGIVADSRAENEYEEIQRKLAAIKEVLV